MSDFRSKTRLQVESFSEAVKNADGLHRLNQITSPPAAKHMTMLHNKHAGDTSVQLQASTDARLSISYLLAGVAQTPCCPTKTPRASRCALVGGKKILKRKKKKADQQQEIKKEKNQHQRLAAATTTTALRHLRKKG